MNRRQFIINSGLLLGCSLASFLCTGLLLERYLERNKTEADKQTKAFPNSLPGATEITKNYTNNSRYCLVHIKQMHAFPHLETSELTNQCQQEIGQILEELVNNHKLTTVYTEGILRSQEGEYMRREDKCISYLTEFKKSGVYKLWFDKKIQLRATELDGVYAAAMVAVQKEEWTSPAIGDKREDALLEIIASQPDPVAVTVFGVMHNFNDNITNWNNKHPDKKFSLVEVMPTSLYGKKFKFK